MKNIPLRNFFLMVIAAGLFAVATGNLAADDEARKQEVLAAEQARIAALLSDDFAALDQILADDVTYAHSSGRIDNKTQFMDALTSGRVKYKAVEHSNQAVRFYGDTAILTSNAELHAESSGKEIHPVLIVSMVWVQQGGVWRLVLWHSTNRPA